jgi:predicted ATPase
VFVSSTLEELAAERAAARRAVEELRFIPVLFELGARPHPPRALYRAYLEQSQVFVGIYWERYGWIAPGMDVSGIEDELTLAEALPRLVYVKRTAGEREPRLQELLRRIAASGVSYRAFETCEELADLVRDDLALLVSERFPVHPEAAPPRVSIPSPVSSFVGREDEVAEVVRLLRAPEIRLVSLTGPGGIGKSRLAFQAARVAADGFADGVVTVQLASLRSADDVVPAIAEALGVSSGSEAPIVEAVRDHVAQREMLVVLDNMEHVLPAAPSIGDLLTASPRLSVLTTSRARLDVAGEYCFRVPPLSLPTAGESDPLVLERSEAVRLFATRAEAAGWKTAEPDIPIVADIVRRLDGLPLAIELAAAQARLVPAELIHTRLRRRLDLGVGPRDVEQRHRTLRNAIAWSYDLLDEPARLLFETLSVFVGGFSVDAAAAIADTGADVEEQLASLVDASLVTVDPAPVTGVRFAMLETIREYAGERLDEHGRRHAAAQAHLAYFARLVDEAYDAPGDLRPLARLRLDEDRDNVRAAFEEAVRSSPADGVRLAGELEHLWSFRGLAHEGRAAIARALAAAPDAPAPWRARALLAGAWLAAEQGDCEEGDRQALEALPLFRAQGDTRHVGMTLKALAWSAHRRGDTERASRYLEESHGVLADAADESLRADAAVSLGAVLYAHGDLNEARRLYVGALDYYDRHSLEDERASALIGLGVIDEHLGSRASARSAYEESISLSRRLENPRQLAAALVYLGHVDTADGRIEDAARSYCEALDLQLDLGDRQGLARALPYVARVALLRDRPAVAAELLGAAAELRRETGAVPLPTDAAEIEEAEADARTRLGADRFATLFAEGGAAGLGEVLALARDGLDQEPVRDAG